MSEAEPDTQIKATPLAEFHRARGATMAAFAGWDLPMRYPAGIMAEHAACREQAALFDVSHMGQVRLVGPDAAGALERLVPSAIRELAEGKARYTVFTNDGGGVLDDLIVANAGDHLFLVVNAARRDHDIPHLRANLPDGIAVEELADRALLALQGPLAATALARIAPDCAGLKFMETAEMTVAGISARVSRLGYTGEDGFEISVPAGDAAELADRLVDMDEVSPAGLGARDSLRLEAGLCLYGSDMDEDTSPIEAGLRWIIQKRRRAEGGFPGAERILGELGNGPSRLLTGISPDGRAPARAGTPVLDATGAKIGVVTSGGFGPTVGAPVSIGYVSAANAKAGTVVGLDVRDKIREARVVDLPFHPHNYHR